MKKLWVYAVLIGLTAIATFAITALLANIRERKEEGHQMYVQLAELTEETVDPEIWGHNFPSQYEGYLRTVDTERTKYGGSEAFSRLDSDPRLRRIFAGYAFGVEFNEERGHAYTLEDQKQTLRVKVKEQPGACLHCHASVIPAYRKAGGGDIMAGFAAVNKMKFDDAVKLVEHPVVAQFGNSDFPEG
ncbi:MAG: ammonia-forming cytochrome c nitrite reductase subunit c552 [bacterium]|nr:ammonia-forming cytochrome c nitrite reductase subunit c552 [bacterium]